MQLSNLRPSRRGKPGARRRSPPGGMTEIAASASVALSKSCVWLQTKSGGLPRSRIPPDCRRYFGQPHTVYLGLSSGAGLGLGVLQGRTHHHGLRLLRLSGVAIGHLHPGRLCSVSEACGPRFCSILLSGPGSVWISPSILWLKPIPWRVLADHLSTLWSDRRRCCSCPGYMQLASAAAIAICTSLSASMRSLRDLELDSGAVERLAVLQAFAPLPPAPPPRSLSGGRWRLPPGAARWSPRRRVLWTSDFGFRQADPRLRFQLSADFRLPPLPHFPVSRHLGVRLAFHSSCSMLPCERR